MAAQWWANSATSVRYKEPPPCKGNHCANLTLGFSLALGLEHVHVAVGFGSNGVMSGPHAGRLAGEIAVGRLSTEKIEVLPTRLAQALAPCRQDGITKSKC